MQKLCEAHPEFPWPHGDCDGPGILCHDLEECVKRLHMEPGDVVLVRLKTQPMEEEVRYIQSTMEALVPGHHIVIHGPDLEIEVLSDVQL
jgi:hypothetical protein